MRVDDKLAIPPVSGLDLTPSFSPNDCLGRLSHSWGLTQWSPRVMLQRLSLHIRLLLLAIQMTKFETLLNTATASPLICDQLPLALSCTASVNLFPCLALAEPHVASLMTLFCFFGLFHED